jgi:ABC-type multidrug transport system fused ATPase/permease subunit
LSEGIITFYYRFLAEFDHVRAGNSIYFGGDFSRFWTTLSFLVLLYYVILVVKYILLSSSILLSSKSIHEEMTQSIMRSPSHFFDSTPSGILVNKFSNDLGIIDNNLPFVFIDIL